MKRKKSVRHSERGGSVVVLISFVLALCLDIMPLPPWMSSLWPLWTVLILIFWVAYLPHVLSPWVAWFIGLFEDVLQGGFLGEHALGLIFVYFLAHNMSRQIKAFSLLPQMTKIFSILLMYQIFILIVQGVPLKESLLFLLPVLISLLLWPWILFLMRGIAIRFYIHRM